MTWGSPHPRAGEPGTCLPNKTACLQRWWDALIELSLFISQPCICSLGRFFCAQSEDQHPGLPGTIPACACHWFPVSFSFRSILSYFTLLFYFMPHFVHVIDSQCPFLSEVFYFTILFYFILFYATPMANRSSQAKDRTCPTASTWVAAVITLEP